MQPTSMNIKSVSPLRINLESLIVITQVSWNATNISNQKTVFINSLFFILSFGINRAAFMDTKKRRSLTIINMDLLRFFVLWKKLHSSSVIERTLLFFKLSTWIIIIIISSCIAVVSMFLLVYPLAATPLFPPCQLVPPKGVSQCAPQGLPPFRCGDGLQMRARYLLLPSPCQPGLVSNGKSLLQMVEEQSTGCMAWQPTG